MPDLHDIVFGHTADDPGVVGVPAEVTDLGGVTSVDEEELGRTILRVLRALLFTNLGQVPDVESAISAGAGEDGLVVGRPLHLEDLVLVTLEAVQLQLEVPQIPKCDSLVSRAGGQDELRVGIEAETVNLEMI